MLYLIFYAYMKDAYVSIHMLYPNNADNEGHIIVFTCFI